MHKALLCLLVLSFSHPLYADNLNDVIYGDDNRQDFYEVQDNLLKELSLSTAAMIPKSRLLSNTRGGYDVKTAKLEQSMRVCSDERFSQQPTAANCSGFLVADDLLVTAGHCIRNQTACNTNSWVFDFKMTSESDIELNARRENVYNCVEIVEHALDNFGTKDDYALIRLDRKVEGRNLLEFRKEGRVSVGQEIVVIGHPSGLPTKVSAGAKIRSNTADKYFVANLDTYGGNSGSAVFDLETGVIEGILVRGEKDYVYDSVRGCRISNQCDDDKCRGEDVTRITNIKYLQNNSL